MKRGYTADWFLGRVRALRAAVPDVSITTDLIAGFPGESEEEFAETLDLVEAAAFDAAFTFVYSPRRGHRRGRPAGPADGGGRSESAWSASSRRRSVWRWRAGAPGSAGAQKSSWRARAEMGGCFADARGRT